MREMDTYTLDFETLDTLEEVALEAYLSVIDDEIRAAELDEIEQ